MNEAVREYYNADPAREWERLAQPTSGVEYASTMRLIERYFPPTGAVVDIGAGPGRYALALARRGYAVTLVDLSDGLLQLAREQFAVAGLHAAAFIHADARHLAHLPDGVYDAALLMGPLYHLTDAGDRATVLRHLHRLLTPGGVAFVAYLNAWGLIATGITDFPRRYRDRAFLRAMLGEQSFAAGDLAGFTEAYWSTPAVARREVEAAGLHVVSSASAEGFTAGLHPLLERLAVDEPEAYANVVAVAAETCELPQYRDSGNHLHLVVRKSEDDTNAQ